MSNRKSKNKSKHNNTISRQTTEQKVEQNKFNVKQQPPEINQPLDQSHVPNIIEKILYLISYYGPLITALWTAFIAITPFIIKTIKQYLLIGYYNYFNISINHINIDSNKVNFNLLITFICFLIILFLGAKLISLIPDKFIKILTHIVFQLIAALFVIYSLFLYELSFGEIMEFIKDPRFLVVIILVWIYVLALLLPIYKSFELNNRSQHVKILSNENRILFKLSPILIVTFFGLIFFSIKMIPTSLIDFGKFSAQYQNQYEIVSLESPKDTNTDQFVIITYKGEKAIVMHCDIIYTDDTLEPAITIHTTKGYQIIDILNSPIQHIKFKTNNIFVK